MNFGAPSTCIRTWIEMRKMYEQLINFYLSLQCIRYAGRYMVRMHTRIQTHSCFIFTRDETTLSRKKERKHSRFTWEQLALENVLWIRALYYSACAIILRRLFPLLLTPR